MSSRSTSPFPPSTDTKSETGTLSNNALYAPLSSTYNGALTSSSLQPKTNHSLTIQTSTSLRESSLLSFLTHVSSSIKSSNPYESAIYKSVSGALTRHGMGDADHKEIYSKSFYESKLSNRSLVLVGGGVHSHAERRDDDDDTVTAASAAAAAVVGRKRVRKRVGGNGMFGSLSGRKRRRIRMRNCGECGLKKSCGVELNDKAADEAGVATAAAAAAEGIQSTENKVIETMNKMWTDYIVELLRHIKPEMPPTTEKKSKTNRESAHPSITIQTKRQIASLLIEAEHAGMAVTIVECPSRRDLIHCRGIVVNETKNSYNVVILMSEKRAKKKAGTSLDDKTPSSCRTWKVVLVPKRGTVLETNIPFQSSLIENTTRVTIRLET
jgi:hypothetical protein